MSSSGPGSAPKADCGEARSDSDADTTPPVPVGTTARVRGIVVTHGSMCFGMVDAVRRIAGTPEDALVAVSNAGRGPDELVEAVNEVAAGGPTIIFTDLQTGSCALAARFACREPRGRRVVFGANLPMLLDFVFHRDMEMDALVERLLEKGRAAIRSFEVPPEGGGGVGDRSPEG